ncbi:MAG: hypothetical protein FJ265_12830, partial [Planctomycetes bacterium]|nr:hypothetical protein [Planctomycetota bacterium]
MAIFVDRVLDRTARWDLRLRLHAWLAPAHAVDLVLPDDAPPLLAHRALQGRVLIERDRTAFTRFFVRTLAEAGDERHA